MTGWLEFAAALAAFFATHFLPTRQGLRGWLIERLGRRVYFSAYGIVSLAVVGWVIVAAGRAPHVDLWWQLGWQRWVPVLTMPVAVLLAVLGVGVRYPHTLGGRRGTAFDPARPGVAAVTRHPLLWSLALWSGAHLVANGDVAHVILFGGFAALSLAAMRIFDRRARTAMSPDEWRAVRRSTAILSLRPLVDAAWLRANRRTLLRSVAIAALVYVAIFLLHEPVIGVTPVPG
ncbi:MAG TPA: NnrU family protein [Paracoccaceae bacterium]|nr:NnrU family protein [Paracoccaceae bacterium]